jgi:hypothetical protein
VAGGLVVAGVDVCVEVGDEGGATVGVVVVVSPQAIKVTREDTRITINNKILIFCII